MATFGVARRYCLRTSGDLPPLDSSGSSFAPATRAPSPPTSQVLPLHRRSISECSRWTLRSSPQVFGGSPLPVTPRGSAQPRNGTAEKPTVTTDFKHALLPIIDRNPYLSESTRQAAAMATTLAKKNNADITVVVIDQGTSEDAASEEGKDNHELLIQNVRWHLSEGGFENYTLVDKLGLEQTPAAVIGELADDLGLDLVIMGMGAIHQKHIDANLLAEFLHMPKFAVQDALTGAFREQLQLASL